MNPWTREEIISVLQQVQTNGDMFWSQFDDAAFFRRFGESWSPAETVRHLTKSTRPIADAMKKPRLLLMLLFGTARRKGQTYEEIVERYRAFLAAGGQAGRFAPSPATSGDRAAIMKASGDAVKALIEQIRRWPEAALDRYQLPHPGLGKLTVREMILFTIYHLVHHRDVIQRRATTPSPPHTP